MDLNLRLLVPGATKSQTPIQSTAFVLDNPSPNQIAAHSSKHLILTGNPD